jgi:hypothetical protein
MKKNEKKYVKKTFEVDEQEYRRFRCNVLSAGLTIKEIINRFIRGVNDDNDGK